MDGEFDGAKSFVRAHVVHQRLIDDVMHFKPQLVIALKVVLHQYLGDPLRVEIVVDQLSLTDSLPHSAISLQ